ncbi:hypothetical protein E4T56_gene13771 [Termitomyces sp. T112]|nr:hypothetical protein E4T56_gene13771 [Termitomyces sp. T112]
MGRSSAERWGSFWGFGGLMDDVRGFGERVVTSPPFQRRDPSRRGAGRGSAGRGSRSQAILINPQRVIAAWEMRSKRGRRFVRVPLNQLKALGVPQGFPNFVMSSPSVPVASPADLDEVVVYDSGGEEFERRRRGSVRDRSQSSVVVVVDFPGVPKWTKFHPAVPKGKGASSAMVWGKRRASPPSGAGPSKRPRGRELSAGPPESSLFSPVLGVPSERSSSPPAPIPSITEVFLRKQVEALMTSLAVREGELRRVREDRDAAWTEKEVMERERNTSVEGQPTGEAEGQGRVPEGDALWAELEAARRRKDWLANEAALGRAGILHELSPVPPFVIDGSFSEFRLGAGASGPLGRCLHSVRVDSGQVDAGVCSPASGVAAGDGTVGEVAGRASAAQCGGPGIVVGGGGQRGGGIAGVGRDPSGGAGSDGGRPGGWVAGGSGEGVRWVHGPQLLPITPRNPAHTFDAHTGQLRRFSGKPRRQLPIRSHQHPLETFPHRSWTRHTSPTPYPSSPDPSRSATTPRSGRAPN